jgi:hypothetical protein
MIETIKFAIFVISLRYLFDTDTPAAVKVILWLLVIPILIDWAIKAWIHAVLFFKGDLS